MPKLTRKQFADYATAYHEAGHAVIEWSFFGLPRIKKISIVEEPEKGRLGYCKNNLIMRKIDYEIENSASFDGKVMREIMGFFAGHVAEKKFTGKANHVGASSDFKNAFGLAQRLDSGSDKKACRHLQDYLYRRTELLVNQKWNFIKAVAKERMSKRTLNRDEFYAVTQKVFKEDMAKIQTRKKARIK